MSPRTGAHEPRAPRSLGKKTSFLSLSPGDEAELFTLGGLQRNLNAVLDIGGARLALEAVGKAFARQAARFNLFNALES
jgi:hypothetical protein